MRSVVQNLLVAITLVSVCSAQPSFELPSRFDGLPKRNGFVGMRGKKDNSQEEYDVNAGWQAADDDDGPGQFGGEAKADVDKAYSYPLLQKREGFLGMRGKKAGNGFLGMRGRRFSEGDIYGRQNLIMRALNHYWAQQARLHQSKSRRGTSGFFGMRG